jgi:hypothetical protein
MRLAGSFKTRKQKSHCNFDGRTPHAMIDARQRRQEKQRNYYWTMVAGRADVEAKRGELLALKQSVADTYATYKSQADLRIARQHQMAEVVQLVQSSQSADVPLVEDVILASLWAETKALRSKEVVPEKPEIDPANQPQGMTKSAEEAIAVYNSQIAVLSRDLKYRQAMSNNETAMAKEFGAGLLQIEGIVCDYCQTESLRNHVLEITKRGGSI